MLSDQEILDIIKEEYHSIQPKSSMEFYQKAIKSPSLYYIKKRFNMTYNEILIEAGISKKELNFVREKNMDKEELLEELKQLADRLGHVPTVSEYQELGRSYHYLTVAFGTYNQAIKEAGLLPNSETYSSKNISKKNLVQAYRNLSEKLKRPATINDIRDFCEDYSLSDFLHVFGGINQLRIEAGFKESNYQGNKKYCKQEITELLIKEYKKSKKHLTAREINKIPHLPSYTTIIYNFKVASLSEVWAEIDNLLALQQLTSNDKTYSNRNNKPLSKAKRIGNQGEKRVAHYLSFLNPKNYKVYNDVKLKVGNIEQQIDHLVVGMNGIFHLETKNYNGTITIDRNGNWQRTKPGLFEVIENPEGQISRHEEVLNRILDRQLRVTSILVYADPKCELRNMEKTTLNVIKAEEIINFIQSFNNAIPHKSDQMLEICRLIEKHISSDS